MEKLKVDVNTKVRASHDVGTTEKNGMEVIARELDDKERQKKVRKIIRERSITEIKN